MRRDRQLECCVLGRGIFKRVLLLRFFNMFVLRTFLGAWTLVARCMDQQIALYGDTNNLKFVCLFAESSDGSVTVGEKEARI